MHEGCIMPRTLNQVLKEATKVGATPVHEIRPRVGHSRTFEVSAKTGAGHDAWRDYLVEQHEAAKKRDPLS
jgi:hypothetical protein